MSSSALPFFLFFFFFFLHLLLLPPCCVCCSRHLLLHAGAGANSSSSLADMLQVTHGGANGSVTDGLRRYLARFGYASSAPDDADGRVVVSLYQSTLGLPVTGRLDAPTLDLLATPRCGVPDLQHSSQANATATATARFAFFDGQPRWARAPGHFLLTYAVLSTPPYQPLPLPRKAVRGAFRAAFARWARVIPVRFRETRDYNTADVRVGFLAGDHGDGEPFDGPLGVLGHAFSPPSGQLHLDAAERWAVLGHDDDGVDSSAVDLESVATHEIGHVLGLAHSSVPDAVMYPSMKPRTRKAELTLDDVRGVQALYGSNPQFSLSSLSEPDTSSSAPAVATTRSPGKTTATHTAILLLLVTVTPLLLLC